MVARAEGKNSEVEDQEGLGGGVAQAMEWAKVLLYRVARNQSTSQAHL